MQRFCVFLGLAALVLLLHQAFPYVLDDENNRLRALYLVLLLSLMLGGRLRGPKGRPLPKMARDIGIWAAIILGLVFAYSFHDDVMGSRLMAELVPSHVRVNSDGTLSIKASDGGHFYVEGRVNEAPVRFLIDTGATAIVLTPKDAQRAGIGINRLTYDSYATTANGTGMGAGVTLDSLNVGGIALEHIPASVNKVWMPESLLGMSFLRRLHGFKVEGNTLVLMP